MSDDHEQSRLAAFDEALLRFGADLAAWPEDERQRAMALLAESVRARALLAEEQALLGAVKTALAVDAPPSPLVARIQRSVAERRDRGSFGHFRLLVPMLAGGAVVALACGAALGLLLPMVPGLNPDALLVMALGGGFI